VLGIAQTGTGKTGAFVLPMLKLLEQGRARARMPRTLILEPTRELAAQVVEQFEKYGKNHKLNVALIIGGCLVGLATGNLLVILQSCAPRGAVGLWTGVYNFIGNIAGILSPLITGFLIEKTGSYTPPFILAAGLIALGPIALWLIVTNLRDANSPEA
jgi:MFS family permease